MSNDLCSHDTKNVICYGLQDSPRIADTESRPEEELRQHKHFLFDKTEYFIM